MAHEAIAAFGDWLLGEYRGDGRFERVESIRDADASGSDLVVRLHAGARSYYEVRVHQASAELQAGFGTESRVVNEAVEQAILDSGGDLDDLLGDELCDLGEAPMPMQHFFERPAFRFTVRLPLPDPSALEDADLRQRAKKILEACRLLFQGCVDEA